MTTKLQKSLVVIALGLGLSGCVSQRTYRNDYAELKTTQTEISAELAKQRQDFDERTQVLQDQMSQLQSILEQQRQYQDSQRAQQDVAAPSIPNLVPSERTSNLDYRNQESRYPIVIQNPEVDITIKQEIRIQTKVHSYKSSPCKGVTY
jgi:thioester reductase-like protein